MTHPLAIAHVAGYLVERIRPSALPDTPLEYAARLKFSRGKEVKTYQPERHAPQYFFLEAFGRALRGESQIRRFLGLKPTQDGGTLVMQCIPQMYVTTIDGHPVIAGLPDMQLAGKQWRQKTRPLIINSGLTGILPTSGPGSEGNSAPIEVSLNGMPLSYMGAGAKNEAAQAMLTGKLLTRDEFDSIDPHNATLMEGRLDDYGPDGITIDTTTLKLDEGSPIVDAISSEHVIANHVEYPCPWCNRYRWWQWEDIRIDLTSSDSAKETIHFECPFCHKEFNDLHRIQMETMSLARARLVARGQHVDEHGQVVGPVPRSQTWALTWTALDSPRIALVYLAAKWFEATEAVKSGLHHKMRRFMRDRLCRPYTGDRQADDDTVPTFITREYLVRRATAEGEAFRLVDSTKEEGGDSVHIASQPNGAAFLSIGVDVQRGGVRAPPRIYLLATAGDFAQSTWDVAWGHLVMAPAGRQSTTDELNACLDRLEDLVDQLAARFGLPVVMRGMDVGDRQAELRVWLKKHPKWWALKDASGSNVVKETFDIPGWIYRREQEGNWNLYLVDQAVRREAQSGFLIPAPQPGAAHLPSGIDEQRAIVRHYCATIEIPDGRGGVRWSDREKDRKFHPQYQARRDLLACRTYNRAMIYAHVSGQISGSGKRVSAADWFRKKS